MRRWLTLFLLVFLPLQAAWAAAGSYCQHESGAAAQHFGHHEHRHQAKAGDSEADHSPTKPIKSPLAVDGDCSFCHPCCSAVPLDLLEAAPPTVKSALAGHYLSRSTSAVAPTPERPNWQRLA